MTNEQNNSKDVNDEFVVLLLAHRHQIIAFIAKQLVNAADVEDVFQKTSLVLWKKMEQFNPNQSFLSWAFGIAFNEVRNHIRVKGRERLYFNPELVDILAAEAKEESQLSKARKDALEKCIDQLPNAQRSLVRQCYLDLESISNVAQLNGLSRGALYKKLARVKQKLSACIRLRIQADGAQA